MIYLDNAATTRLLDEALMEMMPYFKDDFFNANASYSKGLGLRKKADEYRKMIADSINALPEEIFFTSGGTESDNWAIKGILNDAGGRHIVTTCIEHHAVLNTLKDMEKSGYEVTYLGVDENGCIDINELKSKIRPDTVLVSVMYANNEIGTIQNIAEIGDFLREKNIPFHTDAVQAYGHINIDVKKDNIDLLSASAHKFYGPKGAGFLYCRKDLKISGLMQGGAQEKSLRPGTLNLSGIAGMAVAAKYVNDNLEDIKEKETRLRDYFKQQLSEKIDKVFFNGSFDNRLPGNLSVGFENVDGERLVALLDHDNVICSNGAACEETGVVISHVLKAIGLSDDKARGVIRLSLSKDTDKEQIDKAIECISSRVRLLRMMQ